MPDANPPAAEAAQGVPGARYYLVGGGIATLAAAAFLIRDGDVPGHAITILEALDRPGGSLDGGGSAREGYVVRGGRMLEGKYLCTFDLFASIPTLDERRSVTREILDWNEVMRTMSKARLFRAGLPVNGPEFGLAEHHIATLAWLVAEPESLLGRSRISDQFDAAFFRTDFWLMWSTTFAFQPWHGAVEFSRYLARFAHMVAGFNHLRGIIRTVYNQYDSLVRPLHAWLDQRGVRFEFGTRVTDLVARQDADGQRVARIMVDRAGTPGAIVLGPRDSAIVTLGSMTDASSLGGMDAAPRLLRKADGCAWTFWEAIAEGRPEFGRPDNFDDHAGESKWVSFTVTLRDPTLFSIVRDLTGNVPGEGGLITFPDSNWMASIVLAHQPHFIGQPEDVQVLWGYGLFVERPGNFVPKPMQDCTGREILTEILGHLGITVNAPRILAAAICIPCMMPFITSQFLPRGPGDRPAIRPAGWPNLAFVGQFCELPDDVVFTVEYSIRSAQVAAYALLGLDRKPPAVYRGAHDPRVIFHAFAALHDREARA